MSARRSDPVPDTGWLPWPPLRRGTLVRRYKRFLADVTLDTGETVTAHCPNSGKMTACSEPGRPVYLSRHDNPRRKLTYTWELIRMPGSLVGVNTLMPNRLVAHAVSMGLIPEIPLYQTVRKEVRTGASRLDIMLDDPKQGTCYIEVKNCSLVEDRVAMFPDAVTTRGHRHLEELQYRAALGHRSIIFFLIQRMDAERFRPAAHIDPVYAKTLKNAVNNGVEALVYDTRIDLEGIRLGRRIRFADDGSAAD